MNSDENNILVYKDRLQSIYKDLNNNHSYEFNLSVSNGYTVTSRSSEVENIEYHEDMALNVTVYNDYKKGSASTNNLSSENILKTIHTILINIVLISIIVELDLFSFP